MIVQIIAMPIYIEYFNNQTVLGVWFTVLSVLNWVIMFDFGIGNGLRNKLAETIATNEETHSVNRLVTSAYACSGVLACLLIVVFITVGNSIEWNSLFNVSKEMLSADVLSRCMCLVLAAIAVQMFLKNGNSIYYAYQMSAIPGIVTLVTSLCLLVYTSFYQPVNSEVGFVGLSIAYCVFSCLPLLVANLFALVKVLPNYRISINDTSWLYGKDIIKLGIQFLVLQILSMLVFNTREIVISHITGAENVVDYTVLNKIFSAISSFFVLALTPLWSAVTQAVAVGDYCWVRRIYRKGCVLLIGFTSVSIVLAILSPWILKIWLGENGIEVSFSICLFFLIYNFLYMWINLNANIENGFGKLRIQAMGYIVASILYVIGCFSCSIMGGQWEAVLMVNAIALIPMAILQAFEIKSFIKGKS